MKISLHSKKKAITPILATIILIAITLVAGVAIAGFVFGLFGTLSSTAKVSAIAANIPASATGRTITGTNATCDGVGTISGTSGYSFLVALSNSGTSTSIGSISITYDGHSYTAIIPTCNVAANAGTNGNAAVYVHIHGAGTFAAAVGDSFQGQFTTAKGEPVPFGGTFTG